jgi:hypothetical protein
MNRIILLLFCFVLFYGINIPKAQAQLSEVAQSSANIVEFKAAQVKYINNISPIIPNSNFFSFKSIIISSISSSIKNFASFSITSENTNSFSVSLPAHPIILKNSNNSNTLLIDDWQSSTQSGKGEFQKNIWVINLSASLKMGTMKDNRGGVYLGTYPVTFVYN